MIEIVEPLDKALEIEGLTNIWNGNAYLYLSKNNEPIISLWYQLNENSNKIKKVYLLVSNTWNDVTKEWNSETKY